MYTNFCEFFVVGQVMGGFSPTNPLLNKPLLQAVPKQTITGDMVLKTGCHVCVIHNQQTIVSEH